MASDQIKEFFRQKTAKAEAIASGVDWDAKRKSWINSVGQLYDAIEHDYLRSADGSAYVQIDRGRMKPIEEAYLGRYSIPEMMLVVGDEQVLFSPKGVNVVGASGRVDVRGDKGEATLIRQADNSWSLLISRQPQLRLVPLNEETFLQMLQGIMR